MTTDSNHCTTVTAPLARTTAECREAAAQAVEPVDLLLCEVRRGTLAGPGTPRYPCPFRRQFRVDRPDLPAPFDQA